MFSGLIDFVYCPKNRPELFRDVQAWLGLVAVFASPVSLTVTVLKRLALENAKDAFVFDILSCVPILAAKMYFLINGEKFRIDI